MKFKQFLLEQDPGGFDLSGIGGGDMPGGAAAPPAPDMGGPMPPMGGGDLGGPPGGLSGGMGPPTADMGMGGPTVDPNASQAPKKIKTLDVWEVLEKHICKKKK